MVIRLFPDRDRSLGPTKAAGNVRLRGMAIKTGQQSLSLLLNYTLDAYGIDLVYEQSRATAVGMRADEGMIAFLFRIWRPLSCRLTC